MYLSWCPSGSQSRTRQQSCWVTLILCVGGSFSYLFGGLTPSNAVIFGHSGSSGSQQIKGGECSKFITAVSCLTLKEQSLSYMDLGLGLGVLEQITNVLSPCPSLYTSPVQSRALDCGKFHGLLYHMEIIGESGSNSSGTDRTLA